MTLKQLEYFLAIAEAGHITAATKNLNISQPPLSLQLKALEDEFGVQLFERDKRNLTITHEGLILQERAKEIISLVNETVRDLQNLGAEARGTIHIGTIPSVCNTLLPEKIKLFNETHPHVDFQIFEGNSNHIMDLLEDGTVDIGIIREPFNTSLYHAILIRDETSDEDESDYFAAVGLPSFFEGMEGDSISLEELKGKPLIIHRRYNDVIMNACRQRGFSPNIICQNSEISSSVSWAEAGIGVAIVSYQGTLQTLGGQAQESKMVLKKIVQPTISTKSFLVWNTDKHIANIIKQFTQLFE